jgi:hypothetical protein
MQGISEAPIKVAGDFQAPTIALLKIRIGRLEIARYLENRE